MKREDYKKYMVISAIVAVVTVFNMFSDGTLTINWTKINDLPQQAAPVVLVAQAIENDAVAIARNEDTVIAENDAQVVTQSAEVVPNIPESQTEKVVRDKPVVTESVDKFKFTQPLFYGASGRDVEELQKLLKTIPDVYPEGDVTGQYGSLTQMAVKRFQLKYGIVSPDSEFYGVVGPVTREKLNELMLNI